ncbi:hypothetical protein ASPVEDRAFT_45162 [Aspergillus versicolor CBS 583.65]|uniref:Uncharacterized protein n=1 Tax=Aspergillus versicolor CBS 583.65 TaxID=1036611 RepID=A0A1L9PVT4_ASPVE|nr:uncharacterized protein ASPVEDRAFT_45162 [Aspergillus versicolor CBS 583.65]OJJ05660.1 hypothetical protein ASPVEDRAFT_45162 [Aspergillus versicolor CBS 583.65]
MVGVAELSAEFCSGGRGKLAGCARGEKSGNEEQQSGADKLSAEANTNPTFSPLSTIDKPDPC